MTKHAITIGAIFLTIAYVLGVGSVHYGGSDTSLATYVDEHRLNSLGDFLAGVFSPLAFLWLTATVLIQSNELALQRKELTDNRDVMKEQANEAKNQARFLNEQTVAMRLQNELLSRQIAIADQSAKRSHTIALFEKRIEIYNDLEDIMAQKRVSGWHAQIERLKGLSARSEYLFGDDVLLWLANVIETIEDIQKITESLSDMFASTRRLGNEYKKTESEQRRLDEIRHKETFVAEQFGRWALKEMLKPYLDLNERKVTANG